MKALIDGDIFAYAYGGLKKRPVEEGQEDFAPDVPEGEPLPFEVCFGAVESQIDRILTATKSDTYSVFLSSPECKTWRYQTATILPYKENRAGAEKPLHWGTIRSNLKLHHPCTIAEYVEADDSMSIEQYKDLRASDDWCRQAGRVSSEENIKEKALTVICSIDKDLMMVPGWHYNWNKDEMVWQNELDSLKCFYTQLLIGDSTDNILGLFGVGPKSAAVKRLDACKVEQDMFNNVHTEYKARFGSYAEAFLRETGRLLWMQTTQEDRWDRFEELVNGV